MRKNYLLFFNGASLFVIKKILENGKKYLVTIGNPVATIDLVGDNREFDV